MKYQQLKLAVISVACMIPVYAAALPTDNEIKCGKALLTIDLQADGCEIPDSLEITVVYPSLFDLPHEDNSLSPSRIAPGRYVAEIPLETRAAIGGMIVNRGTTRYSVGWLEFDQNEPLHIIGTFSPDGRLSYSFSNNNGFNAYSHSLDSTNVTSEVSNALMRFSCYHMGLSPDEPSFSSVAENDWMAVSSVLDSLYDFEREYALDGRKMPSATDQWLEYNLKLWFAANWRLPYKGRAKPTFGFSGKPSQPPYQYFAFLGDIDYSPLMLNFSPVFGPYHFLCKLIENYPGIEPIGETPVEEWEGQVSGHLSKVIPSPPRLLLDLLASTSFVMQLRRNEPFTEAQLKNINDGFSGGLREILLNRNSELTKELMRAGDVVDMSSESFDLKSFIDQKCKGRPVVVDLWNTWCGPCLSAHKETASIVDDEAYSDIVFIGIVGPSSPYEEWLRIARRLGGLQFRIGEQSETAMVGEYGLEGNPTYLVFDRDHNLIVNHLGFPGLIGYESWLKMASGRK